jgi:catechol 2,3-dioxygenase
MTRVQALGHVVVKVQDARRSESFYADTLGLPVAGRATKPIPMVFFTLGNHHDFAVAELAVHGPGRDRNRAGLAHVAFKVGDSLEELEAAKRDLEAAGVVILYELDHTITRGVHLHDPDGNEVELYVDLPAALATNTNGECNAH